MGLNLSNRQALEHDLLQHVGCEIQVTSYGSGGDVTIECVSCNEVLISSEDFPDEKPKRRKPKRK